MKINPNILDTEFFKRPRYSNTWWVIRSKDGRNQRNSRSYPNTWGLTLPDNLFKDKSTIDWANRFLYNKSTYFNSYLERDNHRIYFDT